jgi:magnesium-transporting ATPase (P-type)
MSGPNRLPVAPPARAWRLLAGQMVHFFALMLWVASVLAYIAGMPQLSVAIVVVIVLNGLFAFAQEYRAERAAERLRDLLPRRATVIRDGQMLEIDASELVVHDLVWLTAGDHVSADLRGVECHDLSVDMSMLTGESIPASVESGAPLFAGTFVVQGEALTVVTATGSATRLAGIAGIVRTTRRPPSPLALELDRVVRTIAAIAVGVGVSFFMITLLVGASPTSGFLFAVGVTVALVPEGLLPTVTLALALGAQRMAGRHALVRRLESVETLGSTTFICTDKTGTLTRNQMTVVQAWTPTGGAVASEPGYDPVAAVMLSDPEARGDVERLAAVGARCSVGYVYEADGTWLGHGDPMEVALDVFARRLGIDTPLDRSQVEIAARFPFDPRRRRMSVVRGDEVLVKGAPEAVLSRCDDVEAATAALDAFTSRGLRVLAVAGRPVGDRVPTSATEAEVDLHLFGLLALEDPPRRDVSPAIEACRRAGIKIAMVTGDHPATAATVASEVGLRPQDGLILCGPELPDDEAVLGALLDRDGVVVARVSPEDKLRIARALRAVWLLRSGCHEEALNLAVAGLAEHPGLSWQRELVAIGTACDAVRSSACLLTWAPGTAPPCSRTASRI